MKHFLSTIRTILSSLGIVILLSSFSGNNKDPHLTSKDGLNEITLSLNANGELHYVIMRKGKVMIENSPLGLICDDQDFSVGLKLTEISPVREQRETYQLKVGNKNQIDQIFNSKSITFKNSSGALIVVDLIAGEEGVAFRYRFPETQKRKRIIEKEITGFHIEKSARGWLQPYNKAGKVTPGYEDFYFNVSPGDTISNPRNPSVGWCMPALFNVNNKKNWVLIAESGTDGSYSGCHLKPDSEGGIYKIAFAEKDETFTLPIDKETDAKPKFSLPWTMPWRVIIIGDKVGDIMLSTLITDVAPESKIEDTSWIVPGKASWSWWSHPSDKSPKIYNEFTDLAASLAWDYTLFDAGWEQANKDEGTIDYASSEGIEPMVWGYSANYFDPVERKKKFKELAAMGVKGVKLDFWCSDRQEVMGALQSLFEDAANEHLLVNLHGTTMPRGWHRTWPNFITSEAVVGTEHYFYEERYPALAAQQNTVLPFTRNVAGPTDYTPFTLTIRKYPRLNTAVHELATSMIYTSGIIHFADSQTMYQSLPDDVKKLLKEVPATWDKTECIMCEPGEIIVLSRQNDSLSYIVGINGTNKELPITLDLGNYRNHFSNFKVISEGKDPLMDFAAETYSLDSKWSYTISPRGGFVIQFLNDAKN